MPDKMNNRECTGPISNLLTCGAIKPTKAMIPQTETVAAVSSVPRIMVRMRIVSTETPEVAADSSPKDNRSML